jgi:hypothetical protein
MIQKFVKSPKFMWIVAGLCAYWFFGPSIPQLIHRVYVSHELHVAAEAKASEQKKPSPAIPPSPAPPQSVAASAPEAALHNLMGNWEGSLPVKEQPCNISLELREDQAKPGQYLGYSKISCQPTMLDVMQQVQSGHKVTPAEALKRMADAMKPSASNFSGDAENGAIKLTAQNTFGLTGSGCSITSFTVMPAGAHDLGTDFTENSAAGCEGGQLVMRKK